MLILDGVLHIYVIYLVYSVFKSSLLICYLVVACITESGVINIQYLCLMNFFYMKSMLSDECSYAALFWLQFAWYIFFLPFIQSVCIFSSEASHL